MMILLESFANLNFLIKKYLIKNEAQHSVIPRNAVPWGSITFIILIIYVIRILRMAEIKTFSKLSLI